MTTKPLRIARVKISNVLGIDELEFRPGEHVTMISGANGSGKTSVLEAIRAVLSGGHDAELVRKGEKKGEVVIVLSDGLVIDKKISLGRSAVSVKHPETGPMNAPQSVLDELTDTLGANPITFLTASDKDRVRLFLQMVNTEPDPEKVGAISGLLSDQYTPGPDAFTTLERMTKDLMAQRRELNRQAKEKKAGADQIRSSLPDGEFPDDTESVIEDSRKVIRLRNEQCEKVVGQYQKDAEERIERIRADLAGDVEKARKERDDQVRELEARITELEAHQKASAARELMESMQAASKSLEADSETFTDMLGAVADLKKEMCAGLPIPGAEILDGELFIDGVAFDHVNESRKMQIAIELATRQTEGKRLPLICVDGLERLDSDSMTLFLEEAKKSQCQMIMTRVSDIPGLSIDAAGDDDGD